MIEPDNACNALVMRIHDALLRFPTPTRVRELSRVFAVLDIALLPIEPEYRRYRFDSSWGPGLELASMEEGSGDDYSMVFGHGSVFGRGFAHESETTPYANDPVTHFPGVLDDIPAPFLPILQESSFRDGDVFLASCVFWWVGQGPWSTGPRLSDEDDDGSDLLFDLLLDDRPEAYVSITQAYLERTIELEPVALLYAGRPLTSGMIHSLNAEADVDRVVREVRSMQFPVV